MPLANCASFEAALQASPELQNALITPAVPASRKRAVVDRLADMLELSRIARNFLFVLIDHRRIACCARYLHSFRADSGRTAGLRARRSGFGPRVERTAARRAQPRNWSGLPASASACDYAVDGALIGGVVARIGSTVYDGSVRGQLQTLERRLSAES